MGRPDRLHDLVGPVEILAAAAQRPTGRRGVNDVAQVDRLVGELDEFRRMGQMFRVFDLRTLAVSLADRLVVGNFLDNLQYARTANRRSIFGGQFEVSPPGLRAQSSITSWSSAAQSTSASVICASTAST